MVETIRSILQEKGNQVWSLPPHATVYEAIAEMADKGVGALAVVAEGQKLVGVISERDYARKVFLKGKSAKEALVQEIMSSPVITATSDYTVDDCMRIMTEYHIRHLPVVEGERLVGMISIGDVVKAIITGQEKTITQLSNYIGGKYPA